MPPVTSYAKPSDLANAGVNPSVLSKIGPGEQASAILNASGELDAYLAARFTLPLLATTGALTTHTVGIAIYRLMCVRGYNPESDGSMFRKRYEDAIAWAKGVADGSINPAVVDSSPSGTRSVPRVITSSQRGWSSRGDPSNAGSGPFQGD